MKKLEYIIKHALKSLKEQAEPVAKETDNAKSDAEDSPFTPAEEKFLGKFDAYGTTHIGIIYSLSDIGIREFITRSGADLNISPDILISLLRKKTIKLVPYTGWGRNNDYTIELQLSLDDVKGLGAQDKAKAETGSTASGAASPTSAPTEPPPPGPEVSWVIPYGELIKESTTIAKQLIAEKSKKKSPDATIYVDKSRILKRLPKGYITQLERIIDMMGKRAHTAHEKQRLVADILDNLAVNLNLTDKQIRKSFEFYKNQNKLKSVIDDLNENIIVEQSIEKPIISPEYRKKWFANQGKLILKVISFWDKIGNSMSGDYTEEEEVFFKTCMDTISNYNTAIMIDAIGTIVYLANTNSNNKAEYMFMDWIQDNFPLGESWDQLPIPDASLGNAYSLKTLFGGPARRLVINDNSVADLAHKFVKSLNEKGIGRLDIYGTEIDDEDQLQKQTREKQIAAKKKSRNWWNPLDWIKAHPDFNMEDSPNYNMKTFYPAYSKTEVDSVIGALLAPFRAKGRKATFVDTLSKEQKIARGKYALVQIIKKINAMYPKAKTKWTGNPTGKFWVDSKGVGIYIIPSSGQGVKYIIYADGTLKTYFHGGRFDSTEKLTNKIVRFNRDKWWIKDVVIN